MGTYLLMAVALLSGGPGGDGGALRVRVPFTDAGEVELSELVAKLAGATGLDVTRPPKGVSLPFRGLGRGLSRKLLAAKLGAGVEVSVGDRGLILTVDPQLLTPGGRDAWERRVRELAAEVGRPGESAQGVRDARSGVVPPERPGAADGLPRPRDQFDVGRVHAHDPAAGGGGVRGRPVRLPVQPEPGGVGRAVRPRLVGVPPSTAAETRPWALVGHSMGALVARDYVEGPAYGGDVSTLVMIAPVNQGSHLAKSQTFLQVINGVRAVNGRRRRTPWPTWGTAWARRRRT